MPDHRQTWRARTHYWRISQPTLDTEIVTGRFPYMTVIVGNGGEGGVARIALTRQEACEHLRAFRAAGVVVQRVASVVANATLGGVELRGSKLRNAGWPVERMDDADN